MKNKIDDLKEAYDRCLSTGKIKEKQIDIELIKSIKNVSEKGLKFIKKKSKDIAKNSNEWTFVFRDYYESLRGLIEAYMLFDGIEADNHQCKNAYICFKYKEPDMDWEFLEIIRLKRNEINYKGLLLKFEDWTKLHINFELHISILKKEIEKKLQS